MKLDFSYHGKPYTTSVSCGINENISHILHKSIKILSSEMVSPVNKIRETDMYLHASS